MKKISKTSILLSFTTLIIMLLPLLMIVIPKMLGLPIAIVKSDAMETTYIHSGSLLFVKSVDAENLIVGEAITYFVNQGEQIYTRRIAAIDQNEASDVYDRRHSRPHGNDQNQKKSITWPTFCFICLESVI